MNFVCNTSVKHFCIIALGYALIITISLSLVVLVFGSKALIMHDLGDSGRFFLCPVILVFGVISFGLLLVQ